MADTRRLKNKGQKASPPAKIYELPAIDLLYFMTDNPDPWQFNLHVFANGVSSDDLPHQSRSKGGSGFSGRPQLIQELAPAIYARHHLAPSSTGYTIEKTLRWWWRFLDEISDTLPVKSVEDFNELHYAHYRHLGENLPSQNTGSIFFGLLDHARDLLNANRPGQNKLHLLGWTAVAKPAPERAVLEFVHVKRLYEHLKHLCFPAIRRFEADPNAVPTRAEVAALLTLFILQTGWNVSTAQNIDVEVRNEEGQLACIRPNPMNAKMSILEAVDDDDESVVADEDDSSTVVAPKLRAGGVIQRAHSNNKQSLSPGNILILLTRQTEPLRQKLRLYREEMESQFNQLKKRGESGRHVDDIVKEIHRLTREIKSPWLFVAHENVTTIHRGNGLRRRDTISEGIGAITNTGNSLMKSYAQAVNARLSLGEKPIPVDITLRDLRDSFIAWRWMTSHSWLDAMLAAGHSDRQSIVRYLKRKQIKSRHHRQFIKVGDALWETATRLHPEKDNSAFTLIVAAKVAGASEEQIQRWCEGKDKTYVGTGCADFFHPPKHIAPYHQKGSGCRTQRCTLCEYAILLPGSEDHLARRLAELRYQRETIPESAWQESDLPQEMMNTEKALAQYEADKVSMLLTKWEDDIATGKHRPVTMEGSYA